MLRRVLPWLAVVALVVAAVVTVHWGGGTSTPGRTPSAVRASLTLTNLTEAESLVQGIRLRARDLPAGFVPGRVDTRTVLDPRARLDLCGAAYPSEGFRLVARSASFVAADGRRVGDPGDRLRRTAVPSRRWPSCGPPRRAARGRSRRVRWSSRARWRCGCAPPAR